MTYRLHAALVLAAKVMCCIQCCLVWFVVGSDGAGGGGDGRNWSRGG